ncbi:cysteate synthase [Lyngbya confervoides]|uniref:Cysteate synthase n=1 Tax=Lyngbya confervoides BDU141951 TaxID=1574623 RepID=A0ABD4T3D4_9CYAN|nr:cysteate synthase [Lyngbya confervoides]MCM1982935.1 cysteate synthase [Lyngbya confervoides BDU141951]
MIPKPATSAPPYRLECTRCGAQYDPDPFRLTCAHSHAPALLRVNYAVRQIRVQDQLPGIFRYLDWLPMQQGLSISGRPVTYASQGLAHHLGLQKLFISFNGYWPEKGAFLYSCSFKELEAIAVLAQFQHTPSQTLVVSSAGNTGRAFATVGSQTTQPVCIVSPQSSLSAYWSHRPFRPNISLVAVCNNADYTDAIRVGQVIGSTSGFFPEGGVYNVARRAGMGLTVIDAALEIGQLPQHYFQAVGSGTGGIAAWEASRLLQADGRFGSHPMRLHLAQNHPFTPLVQAWQQQRPEISPISDQEAKGQIQQVMAPVLTNRTPAYSLTGGVYDALRATGGQTYGISNDEVRQAGQLFAQLEGIDISPAAAVATAALCRAVDQGTVRAQDSILLNITSGGIQRLRQDYQLVHLQPHTSVDGAQPRGDLTRSLRALLQVSIPA